MKLLIKMSSIFQNKQILHIIVEMVVISGIVIYFYRKTKESSLQIELLLKRIQIQDEILQKHETMLNSLLSQKKNNIEKSSNKKQHQPKSQPEVHNVVIEEVKEVKEVEKPKETKPVNITLTSIIEEYDEPQETETEIEREENLDDEIADELNELIE
jgi:hypothetical protein